MAKPTGTTAALADGVERLLSLLDSLDEARSMRETDPWLSFNAQVQALLEDLDGQQQRCRQQLMARAALHDMVGQAAFPSVGAAGMYHEDQRQWYRHFLGDLQQYISGGVEGRCLRVSITVVEVLFLLRLFVEEGVIEVRQLKPVFKTLSRYMATPHQERLSYESIRKKYSIAPGEARVKVRRLLERLLNRAKGDLPNH
ncbi:hypothetical protein [Parapedobacter koreensis]|uniref:Uncharacterized protein n=1 Tax=Parapedobacter koreensis TaxID=332977 RepID=A0A1H7HT53_9SPHI|nr:hypothetical protein [Parapedobacter koreensis]SEK53536.1 hypothetical protein SAMN05421740_10212 [Parapedobacter koreensis]